MTRKVNPILQTTPIECGAACLAMIGQFHGKSLTLEVCSDRMHPGREGTKAKEIVDFGREVGFEVSAYSVETADLSELKMPAIVHWQFNHYVVLERFSRGTMTIVDPAKGRVVIEQREFDEKFTGIILTFAPGHAFQKDKREGILGKWKNYLSGYITKNEVKQGLYKTIFVSLVIQLFGLGLPFATKYLIDGVLPLNIRSLMPVIGLAIVIIVIFRLLFNYLRGTLLIHLRVVFDSQMSAGLFGHLLKVPYSFFQLRNSGDLINRLNSNAWIRNMITNQLASTIIDGFFVVSYLIALMILLPSLGLITLALGLTQAGLIFFTASKTRGLVKEGLQAESNLNAYQIELLKGIATLKASGSDVRAYRQWNDLFVTQVNATLRKDHFFAIIQSIRVSLDTLAPLILIWVGSWMVMESMITIGTMLAFNALAISFLTPFVSLANTLQSLQEGDEHLNRILKITEQPREREEGIKSTVQGEIELRGVDFRYSKFDPPVISQISTHIRPGEKVALVGPTGAGKSTLGMLLVGLFDPERGSILYDGQEMISLDLSYLRQQIGVVLQEPFLFSGSIRMNIAFNQPDLTLEQVVKAAKIACIHDEIENMAMGYDTMVAEGGASLSGGQVQRIALARAVANDPAILLLDEATSHLDANTEFEIEQNLNKLSCTRIHIAHRLSTVINADKILLISEGKIVAQGKHEELLLTSSEYESLIKKQSILKSI